MSDNQDVQALFSAAPAIHSVMKVVGYVRKSGKLQNYTYASERDLLQALRPEMVEQGLICVPREIKKIHTDTFVTKSGTIMNRVIVHVLYAFINTASGNEILAESAGEGSDVGDKALAKAMTNAMKYVLRETFMIETGDDPDAHESAPQERVSDDEADVTKARFKLAGLLKQRNLDKEEFAAWAKKERGLVSVTPATITEWYMALEGFSSMKQNAENEDEGRVLAMLAEANFTEAEANTLLPSVMQNYADHLMDKTYSLEDALDAVLADEGGDPGQPDLVPGAVAGITKLTDLKYQVGVTTPGSLEEPVFIELQPAGLEAMERICQDRNLQVPLEAALLYLYQRDHITMYGGRLNPKYKAILFAEQEKVKALVS